MFSIFAMSLLISGMPCDLYRSTVERAAVHFEVPPGLLSQLLWVESRCNHLAVSEAGAQGIAQLMPATAKELRVDPFKPREAIFGAAKYLQDMYVRFGSWCLAFASYNAGPTAINRAESPQLWATETRAYIFSLGFQIEECYK